MYFDPPTFVERQNGRTDKEYMRDFSLLLQLGHIAVLSKYVIVDVRY